MRSLPLLLRILDDSEEEKEEVAMASTAEVEGDANVAMAQAKRIVLFPTMMN